METLKLTDEHKKLEKLVGNWRGDETIRPSPWDPQGGRATSKWVSRIDLDGFFLISDYEQERNGKVAYRGHGVFGYDPGQKQYLMYWFDSMTPARVDPMPGKWEKNALIFQSKTPEGLSRHVYEFAADGSYSLRIDSSTDGREWKPFVEGKYRHA